ncbi:prolyl oligopeptidase family serine peptidase [Nakamurella aerolata]|uniref:S9 family peptidase n=1 Tax=Nakamurella aerolata TaxID=1656892 RepID=A0A849AD94_9ACTN|nr:prolyl oligopeptidase family serine peptidase [Nakamurella aerolata]NNG34842.1 S9 family peptidase [Nakamurella aerolata]
MSTEQPDSTAEFPAATVPDAALDDSAAEKRWRQRFLATRHSMPQPVRDNPQRAVFISNATGVYELYCAELGGATPEYWQCTEREDGTTLGTLSANGMGLWWFDDDAGDEFGSWMAQPFGSPPGSAGEALPGVAPGYPAGLEVGQRVVLAGFTDDDGTRIHARRNGGDIEVVYRNAADASVAALSRDESLWALSHSERGDVRYPAIRVLAIGTGSGEQADGPGTVVGELDDGDGKGLYAIEFSPVPGDNRLLVGHERRGRDELLIWDPVDGQVSELPIDLPGQLSGAFSDDGTAVIVVHQHEGRSELFRYHLTSKALHRIPTPAGVLDTAVARPDGGVWYRHSSGAQPAASYALAGPVALGLESGAPTRLLDPPGEPAPESQPLTDLWVDGPGGRIHVFVATPPGENPLSAKGFTNTPRRAAFLVHGGPEDVDDDSFDAERAAWLDAGFTVVQVNYRGSSGYGSQWRDALSARVGHTELADLAAVQDHLIRWGVVDAEQCVLVGASWGGFLTLLGLGAQPSRWAVGIAGVPVADYPAAYQQEMEPLRSYDRALFGGSPDDVPDKYIDSSPLSWIEQVRAPLAVLFGRNDPRCPAGQVENYLHALTRQGNDFVVYSYDAGHGSMVVDERIRQVALSVRFALDKLREAARRS